MSEVDRIIGSQLTQRQQAESVQAEEARRRAELLPQVINATSKLIRISARHNFPGTLPIVDGHAPRGWPILSQPPENASYGGPQSHGRLGEYSPGSYNFWNSMIGIDGHFYDVYTERLSSWEVSSSLSGSRPIHGGYTEVKTVKKLFSTKKETVKTMFPAIKPEVIETRGLQSILFTIGRVVVNYGLAEDWHRNDLPRRVEQSSNLPKRIRRTS